MAQEINFQFIFTSPSSCDILPVPRCTTVKDLIFNIIEGSKRTCLFPRGVIYICSDSTTNHIINYYQGKVSLLRELEYGTFCDDIVMKITGDRCDPNKFKWYVTVFHKWD